MIVGRAEIVVRAITNNVASDIKRGFQDISGGNIGKNAGNKLAQAFNAGFDKGNTKNVFTKIADGISTISPEAKGASDALGSMVRTGYTTGTMLSTVAGALSSAVTGIAALVSEAAQAAPAIAIFGNSMISLKLGASVAKLALGGVNQAAQKAATSGAFYGMTLEAVKNELQKIAFEAEASALALEGANIQLVQARLALTRTQYLPNNDLARRQAVLNYQEAILNVKKATAANEQAQKAAKRKAPMQTVNPYAGLTKSQAKFAAYLASTRSIFKSLTEAAASGFLPLLQKQLESITKTAFPTLRVGLNTIGKALGAASGSLSKAIVDPANLNLLKKVFKGSSDVIKTFGDIGAKAFGIILKLLVATQPATKVFMDFLDKLTTRFGKFIDTASKDGSLQKFFDTAGTVAAQFGKIAGNVFGALQGFIKATSGPGSAGQIMLDWLTRVTAGMKAAFDGKNGDKLKTQFADAATNATKIFDAVGALLGQLGTLGANKAVGQTFDILKTGAPIVGDILTKSAGAGPNMATLVVNILKLIDTLTDTESVKIFFDILNNAVVGLNSFLNDKHIKPFVDLISKIHAAGFAFGLIATGATFYGKAVLGTIGKIAKPIGSLITGFKNVTGAFKILKGAKFPGLELMTKFPGLPKPVINGIIKVFDLFMKSPIKGGGLLTIVILLISRFAELMSTSKEFKGMVDGVFSVVGAAFGKLGKAVGDLFSTIGSLFSGGKGGGGLMDVINPILDVILNIAVPAIGLAIDSIVNGLTGAINIIKSVIEAFAPGLKLIFSGIVDMMHGKFAKGFMKIFSGILVFVLGIFQAIVNGFIDLINMITGGINNFIATVSKMPPVVAALKVFGVDLNNMKIAPLKHVAWAQDAAKNAMKNVNSSPRLATGGVVMPRPGGTLATVAEAGRPERIEPLNPNGLSRRDIALIEKMSGGAGNGLTINVHGTPKMDVNELADVVGRKIAFQLGRGKY
jgi:hypothetical protein